MTFFGILQTKPHVQEGSTKDDDDAANSDSNTNPSTPSITDIYTDANLYEDILTRSGCIASRVSGSGDHADGTKAVSRNGFDDLVGRDLSETEQCVAARIAKLSATGSTWASNEPEPTMPTDVNTDRQESESEDEIGPAYEPPILHRASTTDDDSWKLEPDEVMKLLIDEFGPLTLDGETETLILETDGIIFNDVIVMGVIHITSHRLAFHASLLATRPDLHSPDQIIKAGPVIIRRRCLYPKRRYWMELSHDMLCTYASSKPEDRLRPLRTVLLSSINEVHAFDPTNPTTVRVTFRGVHKNITGVAEFDTEESARDWRRELQGAIFLFRHTRSEMLSQTRDDHDDHTGIRISIPLERITNLHFRRSLLNLSSITTFQIRTLSDSLPNVSFPGDEGVWTIQMGPVMPLVPWSNLGEYINIAKKRRQGVEPGQVFADCGTFAFSSNTPNVRVLAKGNTDAAIRTALALDGGVELWAVKARIYRSITSSGYFVVTPHHVGFWSKSITQTDVRYRLSISNVKQAKPFRQKYICTHMHGLALEIHGFPDLRFVFKTADHQQEAIRRINANISAIDSALSTSSGEESSTSSEDVPYSSEATTRALKRKPSAAGIIAPLRRSLAAAVSVGLPSPLQLHLPKAINLPRELLSNGPPLHFVCLTIGSRGDVQPYIALGLGLKKEGHRVTIVTHEEYKDWVTGFGIGHRTAGGDPGALMKLSVEHKMFSPEFFKESLGTFRPWLDDLLVDSWEACKDADVLLESPSAMAGVHIAEALGIPYFRTFTMPWTKTSEFPHAFLSPPVESPTFNSASYILFANVMWAATSGQINRWRKNTLKLRSTDMGHRAQSKIIFIYNFSQAVVPKPLDWGDTTIISGYWFLDNPDLDWEPPRDLLDFIAKARADNKPLIYIGFGSITVPHPNRLTSRIIKAVLQSDVRAIISKGWSARMSNGLNDDPEPEIPLECYQLDKVPHDWLFPQVDAALHHGGAGTTGASLRAGIPTLIKPWFGDQYFWASRVQRLGAGLRVPSTQVKDLTQALVKATTNRMMKERAALVGEKIRSEDGVHTAIHTIYTYLPRASRYWGS